MCCIDHTDLSVHVSIVDVAPISVLLIFLYHVLKLRPYGAIQILLLLLLLLLLLCANHPCI